MISIITKLLQRKQPFAVLKYDEWLKGGKDYSKKTFEVIYINDRNYIVTKVLNDTDVDNFKQNINLFKVVQKDNAGAVYEYENFKKHHDEIFPPKTMQIESKH